jgi:hypothetical protein
MSPNLRAGGGGCCRVSANEYCAHGAQINFGDLTPYLTNGNYPNQLILYLCKCHLRMEPSYLWSGVPIQAIRYPKLGLAVPKYSVTLGCTT